MKSNVSVYSYDSYLNYLKTVVNDFKLKRIGPRTFGQWARRLGYQSPRTFGMVLNGERLPSEELLDAIGNYLELNTNEKEYLFELAKAEKRKKKNLSLEKNFERLQKLNPHIDSFLEINLAMFSYIAKWYHLVLKELFRGKQNYREDYKELASILRHKVSTSEIREGIGNLIKLGLVQKNTQNGTLESKDVDLTTTNDIPSEAIKLHHEGMLDLAKLALREQTVEEREFQAFTFKMRPELLPEAKDYIRHFIKQFNKKFCDENEKDVYQLNINLFSHTEKRGEIQ